MNNLQYLFVISLLFPQNSATIALANPLAGADQSLASWFHGHLTPLFVTLLRGLSEPASNEWISVILLSGVLFFAWKRSWFSLAGLLIAVPIGMLLNELLKVLVQRPRPFIAGEFVDWSGYSFASGHTIGATLLYGQILLFALPLLKSRSGRSLAILTVMALVLSVGFSRIALGAHYLTDVLAAMLFGALWLTFCTLVLKPFQQKAADPELVPNVVLADNGPIGLVPAPVTLPVAVPLTVAELTEAPPVLSS